MKLMLATISLRNCRQREIPLDFLRRAFDVIYIVINTQSFYFVLLSGFQLHDRLVVSVCRTLIYIRIGKKLEAIFLELTKANLGSLQSREAARNICIGPVLPSTVLNSWTLHSKDVQEHRFASFSPVDGQDSCVSD